jgi:hypothetical protein
MALIKTKMADGRPIFLKGRTVLIGTRLHKFDSKSEAQRFYFSQLQEGLNKALKEQL